MTKRRQTEDAGPQPAKHTKERILASKRFSPLEKDFLRALLRNDKLYTVDEAAQLLGNYLKQEAK